MASKPISLVALLFFALATPLVADQVLWEGDVDGTVQLILKDATAPPDTTPPIDPTKCHDGYVNLAGWWGGWCGRSTSSFTSRDDYGAMKTNTQAVMFLDEGNRYPQGWLEIEVYFATDRVPQGTGGLHIMSPTSAHKALGSPIVGSGYAGWLRPDFETKPILGDGVNAELKVGTYNADAAGNVTVKNWNTGIVLRPKVWIPIRFEWRRSGSTFAMNINGRTSAIPISSQSVDLFGMSVGNMDGLVNYGGTPEVRFRRLTFGRLQ